MDRYTLGIIITVCDKSLYKSTVYCYVVLLNFFPAGITIGFNSTDYRVDENVQGGIVSVNISVLNGTLQKNVVISISTESSSAICKLTYIIWHICVNLHLL